MTLSGGWGGYDQLCCQASPKLLLGLDLGLGCDNSHYLREIRLHLLLRFFDGCVVAGLLKN